MIQKNTTRRRKARFATGILATLCLLATIALSQNAGPVDVEDTRATIKTWVETRKLISEEKRQWALGREMLSERVALVQREIDSLKGKIDQAKASITDTDEKAGKLRSEIERYKQASSSLDGTIVGLEDRVRKLLVRLPEPIRQRVQPLSQRLGAAGDGKTDKLSLGERFQNVVGILNEINKFDREITVTSEVRTLSDGASAEVTAMYVGISQGYYVSGNGKLAGVGASDAEGWTWAEANEAAGAIASAIAIVKNEQVAGFVQLPVEIK